jgi:hypothetical protein
MSDLMASREYGKMSSDMKAEMLNLATNYANYVAQKEYLKSRGINYESDTYKKMHEAITVQRINAGTYFVYKYSILPKYDANKNQSYDQTEVATALVNTTGLTNSQRAYLWQSANPKWKNNPFE